MAGGGGVRGSGLCAGGSLRTSGNAFYLSSG